MGLFGNPMCIGLFLCKYSSSNLVNCLPFDWVRPSLSFSAVILSLTSQYRLNSSNFRSSDVTASRASPLCVPCGYTIYQSLNCVSPEGTGQMQRCSPWIEPGQPLIAKSTFPSREKRHLLDPCSGNYWVRSY